MCGFAGVVSPHSYHHTNFKKSAERIAVRGSEPLSMYSSGSESYAYARLPTDGGANSNLSRLATPPFLLFNGLLTNVSELCSAFGASQEAFESDAFCLKEGLLLEGPSFLSKCRGMFAGALVSEEDVLLFRDTIGIKPLYYIHTKSLFAFASEIKALQVYERTIHELAPGCVLRFNKQTGHIEKQVFSYMGPSAGSLEQLLTRAVVAPTQRYLLQAPEKNIALLLSGGVDSSLIAGLLVRHLPSELHTRLVAFSLGNRQSRDVAVARRLAKRLGLRHVCVSLPAEQTMLDGIEQAVLRTESSQARVVKVGLLYAELARAVKQESIDVVIGGEGADELFFGYRRFIDDLTHRQAEQLFANFFKQVFPSTLLQRFDRVFAGTQIEARVPFLDQAVVAFAAQLPPEAKLTYTTTGHISKLPLRQLAKDIGLPAYIYERAKEKMTAGATGKANSSENTGYLERTALERHDVSFQELVSKLYAEHFPHIVERDFHSTETALAEEIRLYKRINAIKKRRIYV